MRFQVLLSLWTATSCLCIDKIPEVAKTKVSKPKRYSLSKLRLCHTPLKQLIQTRPYMSTSLCGEICIRRGFSNRSSVDAVMTRRSCEQQPRERERDRVTSQRRVQHVRNSLNHSLFVNIHHCICHATLFPSRAWTDGKTKDIINCLYFNFESWSSRLWKGATHACGVRPITMHCASCPIRADCACRKEGLCRKQSVWERRGIEDLQ